MNLYIPVETASREIPYKVYLSALLSLKGFDCYIGTKSAILNLLEETEDYVYFDKGFHNGVSQKFYDIIKSKRGLIMSLDEEGAVDYADDRIIKHRYAKELFDYADHVFFWGSVQRKVVQGHIRDFSRVSTSGHPRFQLLSAQYRKIYKKEVDTLTKEHGDYVLINTNMGFGNNINGDDFIRKNYGDRFSSLDDIIAFDKQKCELITKTIREIATKSNQKVILRPHPEEEVGFYKSRLSDLPNVDVIYEGSVVPWILGSSYVVHPDCTTAIEAVFLGKKAFSLLPENYDPNIVTALPLEVSCRITSDQDVYSVIQMELQKEGTSEKVKELLKNYFSSDVNSSEHIVQEFEKIFRDNLPKVPYRILLKQITKNKLKSLYNTLAPENFSRINKLSHNKIKDLKLSWIKSLLSYYRMLDNRIEPVTVQKIHNELFRIRN